MSDLLRKPRSIRIRPFYGFSPEEDGYIGWSEETARDRMLGQIEEGNLQVVCQFINFWKGDVANEEFRRLLNLVRGIEE